MTSMSLRENLCREGRAGKHPPATVQPWVDQQVCNVYNMDCKHTKNHVRQLTGVKEKNCVCILFISVSHISYINRVVHSFNYKEFTNGVLYGCYL